MSLLKDTAIKLILKIIVSAALMIFLIYKVDFKYFIKSIDWRICYYLLISLMINLTALIFMSIRWSMLIRAFNCQPIRIGFLYRYYLIGSFFNIFLPGAVGGDVMRTRQYLRDSKISIGRATRITISERFFGLASLVIIGSISIFFLDIPNSFIEEIQIGWVGGIGVGIVVLIGLYLLKRFVFQEVKLKSRTMTVVLLLSGIGQMGDILIAYLFSSYFHFEIPFLQFFFIMPMVYFVTILPISLGGLGVREGILAAILSIYGVEASLAIGMSFLIFITKVLVGLIGWIIYLRNK